MSHSTQNAASGASNRATTSVSTKILLIVSIFSLPIGVLAYLLAANYTPQIETARVEISGNAFQRPLMRVVSELMKNKTLIDTCDGQDCEKLRSERRTATRAAFDEAAKQGTDHAAELKIGDDDLAQKHLADLSVHSLQKQWQALDTDGAVATAAERGAVSSRYGNLIGQVRQLAGYVGNTSTLILDPDLDSYYVVDVTLLAMPEVTARIERTSGLASSLVNGGGAPVDRAALENESKLLDQDLARIAASNQTSFDADADSHGTSPTLVSSLRPALGRYQSAMNNYRRTLDDSLKEPSVVNASALASATNQANSASLEYWNVAAGELDQLLQARIGDFQTSRAEALGASGFVVLLAAFVAFALGRSITRPLQSLVQNLGPGATLLASSVERIAETSQSAIPDPEIAAIICEELNAHADNMRRDRKAHV